MGHRTTHCVCCRIDHRRQHVDEEPVKTIENLTGTEHEVLNADSERTALEMSSNEIRIAVMTSVQFDQIGIFISPGISIALLQESVKVLTSIHNCTQEVLQK